MLSFKLRFGGLGGGGVGIASLSIFLPIFCVLIRGGIILKMFTKMTDCLTD